MSNFVKILIMQHIRKIILLLFAAISLTASSQEQFKRGLEQYSFIPKGQWITGVSVSYTQSTQDDYQFFIVEGINADTYSFKISPMLMYCFKDNLVAGGKISYNRSMMKVNKADVVIDSESSYDLDNLYRIANNYYAMGCFRNYFSFGSNKRFGMFSELQLQLGGGESKLTNGSGVDFTGTFERNFSLDIGVAPGMVMFLNNYSAIEVNVGVLGFSYTRTRSVTDRIYVSHRSSQSANFRLNLFSITFGVAFYL